MKMIGRWCTQHVREAEADEKSSDSVQKVRYWRGG